MTRRNRLLSTLRGQRVDRPPVCFYEIGGFIDIDPHNYDPYNVYNDPSWGPLLDLANSETDLIRMVPPVLFDPIGSPRSKFFHLDEYEKDGSRYAKTTITAPGRTLTSLTRRDRDVHTVWALEHPIKDVDDLRAYLEIPDEAMQQAADISELFRQEEMLGDGGIAMVDFADPLCCAAALFSMEDYTIAAFTEPELFHALLQKFARLLQPRAEQIAQECPGRLWRIFGPEYAAEPYLPPTLFREYVVEYTKPIVDVVNGSGGYARMHCHGRIRNILPYIIEMGVKGIDPVEPPPQGDVELAWIKKEYGDDLIIFGNLEITDIENMPPVEFEKVVARSLNDGFAEDRKGFVLMPSASPYGRLITDTTLANYNTMVRLAKEF